MSNFFGSHSADDGLQDLVPWADPYITALIEKLRHDDIEESRGSTACELPPPMDDDQEREDWQLDWSPRNWPGR